MTSWKKKDLFSKVVLQIVGKGVLFVQCAYWWKVKINVIFRSIYIVFITGIYAKKIIQGALTKNEKIFF